MNPGCGFSERILARIRDEKMLAIRVGEIQSRDDEAGSAPAPAATALTRRGRHRARGQYP